MAQRKDINIEERQKYELVERQNRQKNEEKITRWATMGKYAPIKLVCK